MEVEIYDMSTVEGAVRFYEAKVKRFGGKVVIRGEDVFYEYPTKKEIVKILKQKVKEDGKGKVIIPNNKSGQDPYISYDDGTNSYYHRDV